MPKGAAAFSWSGDEATTIAAVCDRLLDVPRIDIEGKMYRATYAKFLLEPPGPPQPLYFAGSISGRRYTPRGGPAGLYLSLDPTTPMVSVRIALPSHR